MTGNKDFVITIVVRAMTDYEDLLRRWRLAHPSLDGTSAYVVIDRVKAGMAITVEPTPTTATVRSPVTRNSRR